MSVLEKTQELADAIRNDPALKEYMAAREAYENNNDLATKMTEYNAQRTVLGHEFNKDVKDQDPALLEMVRRRMDELAREISAMDDYKNFSAAQLKVTDLMNKVNSEIQRIVFGIVPDSECTHDCSTCHANCGGH